MNTLPGLVIVAGALTNVLLVMSVAYARSFWFSLSPFASRYIQEKGRSSLRPIVVPACSSIPSKAPAFIDNFISLLCFLYYRGPLTPERREKIRKSHLGKPSGMLGKHHSLETITKIKASAAYRLLS